MSKFAQNCPKGVISVKMGVSMPLYKISVKGCVKDFFNEFSSLNKNTLNLDLDIDNDGWLPEPPPEHPDVIAQVGNLYPYDKKDLDDRDSRANCTGLGCDHLPLLPHQGQQHN